jgi:hypothetical protein
VAQGTNLPVQQQAASPPLPTAGSETFLGDWEGDFGVLRVTSGPAGLAMDEPKTGFHSTASKVVGATAMFQWSNYGQIFTLASAGEGWVTVSCYPSTAGGSFNGGELPSVAPHWQARAMLKTPRQIVVAGAATPAPQAQVAGPVRQTREITVDAKEGANSSRVSLGPVMKGQRVTFQYVRGQWSNTPRRDFPPGSPDDVPVAHHCVFPLRFCENKGGSVIELGTVPGNTRGRPFTFVADRDIADLVLNQNDPFPNNNVGSVTYRITIDRP